MKKIALGILAIVFTLPAVFAQENTNENQSKDPQVTRQHPGKYKRPDNHAKNRLNLTPEQREQLAKINKDYRSSVEDLKKKEATITAQEYRIQMEGLNKKRREESDKVFTKEQKDQMKQMREERRGKPDMMGRGPRGGHKSDPKK